MSTLKKIKELRKTSESIKDLFNVLVPKWNEDRKTFDKVRIGFKEGGSDGWHKSCESLIHFEAWCGVYGDSSTYNQISMDGVIFKKHFLKYLNSNKKEIMLSIAESIDEEAKDLKDEAEEELRLEQEKLSRL